MFFLMEIGRNFQKKVSFVERRLFSKCSNVHFDRKPDTPARKFLPKVQNELKRLRKILQKDWHFPSIFSSGLLQTCGRMQEKKDTSRTRKCEKLYFKIINVDGIALKRFSKTFFFHVVKFCEKEFFHFRKLKGFKNCLFAETYAPNFLKINFNRIWRLKKQPWYLVIFLFLHPCLKALQKSSAQKLHFSQKDCELRLHFKPMFNHVKGKNREH